MAASGRLSVEDGRRRRAGALAAFALAAGLLHFALLGGVRWTWDAPERLSVPVMRIRSVAAPVSLLAEAVPVSPPAGAVPVSPSARAVPVSPPAGPVRAAAPARRRPAVEPAAALASRPASVDRGIPGIEPLPRPLASPNAFDEAVDEPPPVYRTQLPPPVTLHYDVRRGSAEGRTELRWRLDAGHYALDWQVRVGDVAVLTQSSRGSVDAAGIAPLRFVDQRPSRAAAAVNFRRDLGRIAFSRKSADAVLVPGAQDRLSWLLQLSAIVAAGPELRREGAEVRIAVAGAGGDVAVWRFRCEGEAAAPGDAGPAAALRYVREPRGPYETRAEVWLDPGDGRWLPVRASWKSGPADDGFELRLREVVDGTAG